MGSKTELIEELRKYPEDINLPDYVRIVLDVFSPN